MISNPRFEQQIISVEKILTDLGLSDKPVLLAFNKEDLVYKEGVEAVCRRFQAVSFSALHPDTFNSLIKAIEKKLWPF